MNKVYVRAITIICLCVFSSLFGMDGKSLREHTSWELPKLSGNIETTIPTLSHPITVYRDKKFICKLSELIGSHTADLDAIPNNFNDVDKSVKIKTGHWHVIEQAATFLSTGNVYECITIVFQSKNPSIVGMYHYFQQDDEDFKKLYEFLDEVKAKATRLSIPIPDFNVSIISSYLSINFLIIKRVLQAKRFVVALQHAPLYAWLADGLFVEPEDCSIKTGRLIVANHSDLKVYADLGQSTGYDPDPNPDREDCCIM